MDIETVSIPTLPGIEFGEYPVTQEQYRAVMAENYSEFAGDNLPVECVDWFDAQEFCRRLSAMTGKRYRLPTAAEWDAAQSPEVKTGWFKHNSDNRTHPVGQLEPNEFGLYDMHGNVWEWCEDVIKDQHRALRGGDYNSDITDRVYKYYEFPEQRYSTIGFRVVLDNRKQEEAG